MKQIAETQPFERIIGHLDDEAPNFEVLNSLEGILAGIQRGAYSAEAQEHKFLQAISELYKSHFELHHSFEAVKDLKFINKPKYASFLTGSMVNLLLDYAKALFGVDLSKINLDVKGQDFDENSVIRAARGHFAVFKNYVLRANENSYSLNFEAVCALDGISNTYEAESRTNPALMNDCQFFSFMSKLARHQLKLRLLFEDFKDLDFSNEAKKYDFGRKIHEDFFIASGDYHIRFSLKSY